MMGPCSERYRMIAAACAGPKPGTSSSSCSLARLTLTLVAMSPSSGWCRASLAARPGVRQRLLARLVDFLGSQKDDGLAVSPTGRAHRQRDGGGAGVVRHIRDHEGVGLAEREVE